MDQPNTKSQFHNILPLKCITTIILYNFQTLKQIFGSVLKVDGSVIIDNAKLHSITFFEKLEVISCKKPYSVSEFFQQINLHG